MTPAFNVGAFVLGAPTSPRALVRHPELLAAYADGAMLERDATGEAYLSHFAFGADMQIHFAANRQSVAGFAGPCRCRWLVLDLDRPDLADALADARRLVAFARDRYGADPPVYFSGGKGFHVLVELAHQPPPAVGFQNVARAFAEQLAARAGVRIDPGVFDVNRIVRLPNTRHSRTGLFKRRIDADDLFRLDLAAIRRHSEQPAGDGMPTMRDVPRQLVADWTEAETANARATETRIMARRDFASDSRAPRYFLDLCRFGVAEGERHATLFRCAAWLTEQRAPAALVTALLTEPGQDVGLTPRDVERQIRCGIEHARRQLGAVADPDADERWAIQHEDDPLLPDALTFPFGANTAEGGAG
jgi:hypothetical protein